jgi:hypothetical protein
VLLVLVIVCVDADYWSGNIQATFQYMTRGQNSNLEPVVPKFKYVKAMKMELKIRCQGIIVTPLSVNVIFLVFFA